MEVTRLLPSPASGESENWYPVRGLAGRGLGERALARRPRREGLGGAESFGLSSEALGESESLLRPRGCPLALIFCKA